MQISKLTTIDHRGRVNIPNEIIKSMDLTENQRVVVLANPDEERIEIIPYEKGSELTEIKLVFEDQPGKLAHITSTLAQCGGNLVRLHANRLSKGGLAECRIILDKSKCKDVDELRKKLEHECKSVEVLQ